MILRVFIVLLFLAFFFNCKENKQNPVEHALRSSNDKIKKVMEQLEAHEVQILYTEISEGKDGSVEFRDFDFQLDDSLYFYPASSVKFPIAILALEKVNEISQINRNTPFSVSGDSVNSTVANDINQIFAVSDNAAFNRLYEFFGKDDINARLNLKGIPARLSHRLSVDNSADTTIKSVDFFEGDSIIFSTEKTVADDIKPLKLRSIEKGVGYTIGDSLVKSPMDFSKKNYLPISSLHGIMKRLMFPQKFKLEQQFKLSEEDRSFLLNSMKSVPRQSGYDETEYYDGYVKFFMIGDTKDRLSEAIDIYNKVGYAYGYLTDCAYIVDKKSGKSAIITATIHVNDNQIYNDGVYEYETIGIPFLAELGRQLMSSEN